LGEYAAVEKTKMARRTERTTRDAGHPLAVVRVTNSKLVRLSPYKKKMLYLYFIYSFSGTIPYLFPTVFTLFKWKEM